MGRQINKLTDKTIEAAKPGQKLGDGVGLYLVVSPRGAKWRRFNYRFDGKQQSLSLGIYGGDEDSTPRRR